MMRAAVGMLSSGFLTARKRCCIALVRPATPATMWPNLLESHQGPQESGSPQESDCRGGPTRSCGRAGAGGRASGPAAVVADPVNVSAAAGALQTMARANTKVRMAVGNTG